MEPVGERSREQGELSDLRLFEDGAPWEVFAELRRTDPIHWTPEAGPNQGFWSVTRHEDIVRVERDVESFSSEVGAVGLEELDDQQLEIRRSMLETDGSRHMALRRLLQRDFSARNLAGYESFLRSLTTTTLERALAQKRFDFVKEVSADFPIRVLVRLLGVPDEDADQLIEWGNRMIGNTDPEYADVLADSADSEAYRNLPFRSPAALEVFRYGRRLAMDRRGHEGEDLVSKLVNRIPEDGVPLSERDFDNYFLLLVVAGNETTRHAITHTLKALIDHPAELQRLIESPELIAGAADEFLRWASPVYHFRRTATREVELNGRTISEGDKVVLWFASGNRDEAIFAEPERFDVGRRGVDHLTFGKGGPHFCLGSALAKLEIRVIFEELIKRVAAVRAVAPERYVRSNFIHGIKSLPVEIDLRTDL
jgi:cytochrome P450